MQTTAATRRTLMLTAAAIAAAALALAGCQQGAKAGATGAGEYADDMTMGSPNAKVTVVEYASVTCPHCAHFNEAVFPAFKAKYIDTGKIFYVFREFPLNMPGHEGDGPGFMLARCSGKDHYFKVVDAIFRSQPELERTGDIRSVFLRIAQSEGMNEQQALNCMEDANLAKTMTTRVEREGKQYDIEGTPTFIINGKKLDAPEADLPALDAAIQPLLAKKG
jgi:protein-disulfide isomerase